MYLTLHNRFDNTDYELTIDSIWVSANPQIYQFSITMPSAANYGEYDYALYNAEGDTTPLEFGILKYIPESRVTPIEYTRNTTYYAYRKNN